MPNEIRELQYIRGIIVNKLWDRGALYIDQTAIERLLWSFYRAGLPLDKLKEVATASGYLNWSMLKRELEGMLDAD